MAAQLNNSFPQTISRVPYTCFWGLTFHSLRQALSSYCSAYLQPPRIWWPSMSGLVKGVFSKGPLDYASCLLLGPWDNAVLGSAPFCRIQRSGNSWESRYFLKTGWEHVLAPPILSRMINGPRMTNGLGPSMVLPTLAPSSEMQASHGTAYRSLQSKERKQNTQCQPQHHYLWCSQSIRSLLAPAHIMPHPWQFLEEAAVSGRILPRWEKWQHICMLTGMIPYKEGKW